MTHVVTAEVQAYRERERSVLLSCSLGLGGVFAALVAILNANSVTLYTDLVRGAGEFLASLLAWLTLRKVARGSTASFNYGYGKLENLSTLAIAFVMIVAWAGMVYAAIGRLRHPVPVYGVELGLTFDSIAAVINGYLWRRSLRIARKSPSPIMESQWRLFRTKAAGNLCAAVSLSLILALGGHWWTAYIDSVGSLLLSGFLLFTAYSLIASSMYDLMDRALEEALQLVIVGELADFFDRYVTFHGTRSRRSGANVYIEIFLEFDGAQLMSEVQRTIDEMKESLERKIPQSQVVIVPGKAPIRA